MVYLKNVFSIENWFAQFALPLLFLSMYCQMFGQISLLSERLRAGDFRATERSFASVNSQMVKKVMPFSEVLSAIREVAFQNFYLTLRTRIFVLENSKISCFRNLIFYFNRRKVKIFATNHLYLGVFWNLICNFYFCNLLRCQWARFKLFRL